MSCSHEVSQGLGLQADLQASCRGVSPAAREGDGQGRPGHRTLSTDRSLALSGAAPLLQPPPFSQPPPLLSSPEYSSFVLTATELKETSSQETRKSRGLTRPKGACAPCLCLRSLLSSCHLWRLHTFFRAELPFVSLQKLLRRQVFPNNFIRSGV